MPENERQKRKKKNASARTGVLGADLPVERGVEVRTATDSVNRGTIREKISRQA